MSFTKRLQSVRSVLALDNVTHPQETVRSPRKARRPAERRLIQLYSALLHNAYLKGFITGDIYKGNGKFLCAPGFNCYSCPGAVGACPLGALQNALASADHRVGWYVLGILLLYGVILGRTICGWLCPLGLVQELLHKIPTPKLKKSSITRTLTLLKYVLLTVFAAAIPLWYSLRHGIPLPAFCKYICPAGTAEGAVGLLSNPVNAPMFSMLGLLFTRKFVIMLALGLLCVFCYRAFCRFVCPLGAIYSLFSRFSIVGVRVDEHRCSHCGACVSSCGMDVRHVGDRECIQCGKCMSSCSQDAISIKADRITLKAPETGSAGDTPHTSQSRKRFRRILWAAALALLAAVLLWVNVLEPSGSKEVNPASQPQPIVSAEPESTVAAAQPEPSAAPSFESGAPVGYDVGQRLQDFKLTCYDGSEFRLSEQRGKITFINFWATYCTPCLQELPYFDALYQAHEGDISMIAVHSSFVTKDPVQFLSDKGYSFPFAQDNDSCVIGLAGGSSALPQTVVLNRKGEVVYNKVGSVTPELLEALYQEADQLP
ncbi:MAG: redoxin family protein [Lachnospiraceae bacterium]|nr:redoxin family protein [Lachnospiraceae bacterium]